MNRLDHEHEELEDLIKGTLEINAGLESILRHPSVKKTSAKLEAAMIAQVRALINTSDVFKDIDKALHPIVKNDRIDTESDYLEVWDAVNKNIKPLSQHKIADVMADFFILVFNLAGQDFLNKQNIPATFELTNEGIINDVKGKVTPTLKGVDETTAKWATDQIYNGRTQGLSNAEIADQIREKIPETYAGRAERIVRTETSNMVGDSENEAAVRNGASHKQWVTVGGACPICAENEAQGVIGIDAYFASGDDTEPAHPNCRCVVEYIFTPFMGTIWHGQ